MDEEIVNILEQLSQEGGPASENTLRRIESLLSGSKPKSANSTDSKEASSKKKSIQATKKATESSESLSGSFSGLEQAAQQSSNALDKTLGATKKFSGSLMSTVNKLDGSGDDLTSIVKDTGSVISGLGSKLGTVGKVVTGAAAGVAAGFGFALGAATKLKENFYTVSKAGASFGGSLVELKTIANDSGFSLATFSTAISKNVDGLTRFSSSASDGGRALGGIMKQIRNTGLENSLRGMGVSLKEQPEFVAEFMSSLGKSGLTMDSFGRNFNDLARIAVKYKKDMTVISELTGKSADEQKRVQDQLRTDAAFQASILKMQPEQRKALETAIAGMSATEQEMMKQKLAFGGLRGETAKAGAMFSGLNSVTDSVMNALKTGSTDLVTVLAGSRDANRAQLKADMEATAGIVALQAGGKELGDAFLATRDAAQQFGKAAIEEASKAARTVPADKVMSAMGKVESASMNLSSAIEGLGTKLVQSDLFVNGVDWITTGVNALGDSLKPGGLFDTSVTSMIDSIKRFVNWVDKNPMLAGAAGLGGAAVVGTASLAGGYVAAKAGGSLLKKVMPKATSVSGLADDVLNKTPKQPDIDAGKKSAKVASKGLFKSFLKKLPVIGAVVGAGLAIERAINGDFIGAGLELGSGVASLLPGPGTAASLAQDAALIAYDMSRTQKTPNAAEAIKQEELTSKTVAKTEDLGVLAGMNVQSLNPAEMQQITIELLGRLVDVNSRGFSTEEGYLRRIANEI